MAEGDIVYTVIHLCVVNSVLEEIVVLELCVCVRVYTANRTFVL